MVLPTLLLLFTLYYDLYKIRKFLKKKQDKLHPSLKKI